MSPTLSQDNRIASLVTPLGSDVLVCQNFDGEEGISELFEYCIEVISETDNIDFDSIIGQNCTLTLKTYGNERKFDGILTRTEWLGWDNAYYRYKLYLQPWLWLLSRTSDSRIFHQKTAVEIISQVFGDHGFARFSDRTTSSYPTLEYTVQYRETDMNFVLRLMEQHGICFYFEHNDGQHTLVMADSKSSHSTGLNANLTFRPLVDADRREEEVVHSWVPKRCHNTGRYVLNDYDYLKPNASLKAEDVGASSYTENSLEMYDYPGPYSEAVGGDDYVKYRLEAEQAKDFRRSAEGDAASLTPGFLTTLVDHPHQSENQEYLVVKCQHSYSAQDYRSGGQSMVGEQSYFGAYEFLPAERQFRVPLTAQKPRIHSTQTAKVVGEGEIDVDEHGRILVEFFWDREKQKSRRVRLLQQWADQGWGVIFIPRIGQEVVVQFIEGDPDRPLVMGCVYNADKTPPYDLPAEKTIAGWKSNSTPGGGGYNEFIFDDKKGDELIRMHGEKNHEIVIENNEDRLVKNDVTTETGRDRTQQIGRDHTETVDRHHNETIKGNHIEKVFGQHEEQVQMNWTKKVSMNTEISTMINTTIKSNAQIVLECGGSKITMTPFSIEIKSSLIDVNGVMTTVQGSALLTLKGGLVMIN